MSDAISISPNTPEWAAIWDGLGYLIAANGLGDGLDMAQSNNGSEWQHMGSYRDGARVRHEFRHRDHPKTGKREYLGVVSVA